MSFSNEAEMLGVVLDLSKTGNGEVIIKNKKSRMVELAGNLDALIREKWVEPKRLSSLFGRALFRSRED